MMTRRVGIVGAGNIGAMRARLLTEHPFIDEVLVNDVDQAVVGRLTSEGRPIRAAGLDELIHDATMLGYVVATRSQAQAEATRALLPGGAPILVEKPFTNDGEVARSLLEDALAHRVKLYAGYTQRFRRKFLSGYRQVREGELGNVHGVFARFYSTLSVARSASAKSTTTPARTLLPHLLDLLTWYLGGRSPERVTGRSTPMKIEGQSVPGTTWALLEYDDDCVVNITVSWQLPEQHPAYHASFALDVLGSDGFMTIDDLHTDGLVSSDHPITMVNNPYTGAGAHRVALLGSYPPGDQILGRMQGPVRDETNAFVEVMSGRPDHPILATGREAQRVAAIVQRVDHAACEAGPATDGGADVGQ